MTDTITAHVHRDEYPNPHVGDRCHDEELGPLVLTAVKPDGDGWEIKYSQIREPNMLGDEP